MKKADITKYQQKFRQKVEILSAAASAVSATQNRIAELYPQLSAILFLQFLQVQLWQLFSDAESADISALDADDFTDVTLAKVTLLM